MKTQQIKISVPGLVSVQTAMRIERETKKIRSVRSYISLTDKTAEFWYNPKRVSQGVIIQRVKDLGFELVSVDDELALAEGSPLFSRVVNGNMFEVSDIVCRHDVTAKRLVYLCATALRGSGCAAENVTKVLCEKYDIDYAKPHSMKFSAGEGVTSIADGEELFCGSRGFMKKNKIKLPKGEEQRIYAADSVGLIGWIALKYVSD